MYTCSYASVGRDDRKSLSGGRKTPYQQIKQNVTSDEDEVYTMLFNRTNFQRFREKYPTVDAAVRNCFASADATYNRAEWGNDARGQTFSSYEAGFCGERDSVYERSSETVIGVCFEDGRAIRGKSYYQLAGVARSVNFTYNPYDRVRAYKFKSPEYCEIYPGTSKCYLDMLDEMLWYGSFGNAPSDVCNTSTTKWKPPDLPEDHFEILEKKLVAVGQEIKDAIQVRACYTVFYHL